MKRVIALLYTIIVTTLCVFVVPPLWAASGITGDEYRLYVDWKDGIEHPNLKEYSDEVKLRKLARVLNVGKEHLKVVIEKVEPIVEGLSSDLEGAILSKLKSTSMADRLMNVEVNTETSQVVSFVQWRCGEVYNREKEAALAAWAVGQAKETDLISLLLVWCVDDKGEKIFSAQIGQPNLARIKIGSIERFAQTRYWRLFEKKRLGSHDGA